MLELKEGYNGQGEINTDCILNHNDKVVSRLYREIKIFENKEDAYDTTNKILSDLESQGVTLPMQDIYYIVPEVPTIRVNYHHDKYPDLIEMEKNPIGDFIDLRVAEATEMKQGDFRLINLGISIQLPKGYHAEVVPRSSTYKNFGIIMSNSIGIIDESYCGDGDIWKFPAIAMRDTKICVNDRICQFRIVKNRDINIEVVDKLGNEDRGGIGSTGKN